MSAIVRVEWLVASAALPEDDRVSFPGCVGPVQATLDHTDTHERDTRRSRLPVATLILPWLAAVVMEKALAGG
jgi:hypothetical protein